VTDAELDRLADLIARALMERPATGGLTATWVPAPIRPAPPERSGEPPVWSGAAQELGDVAPGKDGQDLPRFRASTAELTRATRAAASGRAPPPDSGSREPVRRLARSRAATAASIEVRIGVSNRHVHLSTADTQLLFGSAPLTIARQLTQPGQFAANELLAAQGPKGRIDGVRVVGPTRGETQLEIALSDATVLGLEAPVAASGVLGNSAGGVALVGPAGRVELKRGVIVAARHLHLAPSDARRWGLRDGDALVIQCGAGARAVTFHDVLVRSGEGHATEFHLDADEAHAAGVKTGDSAIITAWRTPSTGKRPLVTERDVIQLARRGERVPANAILTPSARDRAAALGILDK